PVGAPRALGPWTPHALAVEPAGRVAVVGAEHEGPVNSTTAAGRRAPRVETLDAHSRTISVARRREPHTDYPGGVTATYDPASRSALVAWLPLPSSDIRIERIRPDGRGGTRTLPVLAEDNPMP